MTIFFLKNAAIAGPFLCVYPSITDLTVLIFFNLSILLFGSVLYPLISETNSGDKYFSAAANIISSLIVLCDEIAGCPSELVVGFPSLSTYKISPLTSSL